MANFSFLYMLVAVVLLSEVVPTQVSAESDSYYKTLRTAAATRLRRRECKDHELTHKVCQKLVKGLGYQVCETDHPQMKAKLKRSCAKTCNFCQNGQLRKSHCSQSEFGCCWDGHTPQLDLFGKGCPAPSGVLHMCADGGCGFNANCKDHLRRCHLFKRFCNKGTQHNAAFMVLHCAKTCGKCSSKVGALSRGEKIRMSHWLLL